MTTTVRNLIDGQWTGDPITWRRNPARRSQTIAVAPSADATAVADALTAAQQAQLAWAALPAPISSPPI
jgi:aldehyde dehydrogenase (NAD+)